MKLNPDDLDVMSFDTGPEEAAVVGTTIINPNEPTPATYCRICPERTSDCY
jgi:hypothetical protein